MLSLLAFFALQDPSLMSGDGAPARPALDDIRRAYAEGRDSDAVVACDRALVSAAGGERASLAEVHFWRGASLRRLRRHAEALVALDAARDLGHAAPELHLERALALASLGQDAEAQEEMDRARRLVQDDDETLKAFERRWRARGDAPHRFELRVRPFAGYDTNIVAVDDDATIAGDPDRESLTYGMGLSARFKLLDAPGRTVAAELASTLRGYASEPDLSYVDSALSLCGSFALADWVDLVPSLALAEAWLAEDGHFRTQRTAGVAGVLRPSAGWSVRLWGEFGDADYYFDAPASEDRDGTYQQGGISLSAALGDWRVGPFVTILKYDAEGDDYDRIELQPGFSVTAPPISGAVELTLTVAYVRADFDEPNSLTGFTEEREDRRWIAALTVKILALEKTLGVAPSITIRFESWSSNIDAYDFNRFVPEVDFSFLAWSF